MRARVPQDVDLEDRLLFGLTATRFGEVALAGLAALAAWRLVPWVGGVCAVLLIAVGALLGWGRWRGRGPDHWALSTVLYAIRTYRLEVDAERIERWRARVPRRRVEAAPTRRPRLGSRVHPVLRVLDGPLE